LDHGYRGLDIEGKFSVEPYLLGEKPVPYNGSGTKQAGVGDYLALMSAFPTGVAVVTSADRDGTPFGLTCSSLSSVTLRPPTLLVCLRNGSLTLDTLIDRGCFAVNLLHADGQDAAELFAGPRSDRFAQLSWRPSGLLEMPWLDEDALAVAECTVSDTMPVGDHTVVFGLVAGITHQDKAPLLYGLRRYAPWPVSV
jgi:flavin reductase (DIM6/NTAB) family NADH-FMN oxidoreductase RutF